MVILWYLQSKVPHGFTLSVSACHSLLLLAPLIFFVPHMHGLYYSFITYIRIVLFTANGERQEINQRQYGGSYPVSSNIISIYVNA